MNRPEIGRYTRSASKQRLIKHVPTVTNLRATIEVLLETGVSNQSVPSSYKEDSWVHQVSSVRESVRDLSV